jgi:hypothetical protein
MMDPSFISCKNLGEEGLSLSVKTYLWNKFKYRWHQLSQWWQPQYDPVTLSSAPEPPAPTEQDSGQTLQPV